LLQPRACDPNEICSVPNPFGFGADSLLKASGAAQFAEITSLFTKNARPSIDQEQPMAALA
jgi:hypothetical protein